MKYISRIIIFVAFHCMVIHTNAQTNEAFRQELDSIAKFVPALNEKIDFTVNDIPLHEFIRGIANEAGLNVNLDRGLNQSVSNNFKNVQVKELLYFVKSNYNVNIEFIGNILNIRTIPEPQPPVVPAYTVNYNAESKLITIEAKGASMSELSSEITRQTGVNMVVPQNIKTLQISTFIKDLPVLTALKKMGLANNFKINETEEGFLVLESTVMPENTSSSRMMANNPRMRGRNNSESNGNSNDEEIAEVNVYTKDSIDIKAVNAPLNVIIEKLFTPLGVSYQYIGEINEKINLEKKGVSLDELLADLFAGLKIAVRNVNGTYWIGGRDILEMKEVKVIPLRYRSIDSLQAIIPTNLKSELEIIDYADMNSLIVAGAKDRVTALNNFLKDIDKLIPVVLIEVIIVDNKNSKKLETGITAGLSEEPVKTSGNVLPSVDMTLSSNSINKVIDGFNGWGWVNLGKVKSNFYMTLKALDENGYVDIKSTPQLATMNGHKATMSIGRTEYYKEELNTLYGSVTSSSQTTSTYKPVEAELKLELKPIISGNQDITLQISVEQSDFTDRIEKNAPPGKVSRKFDSVIRIQDQEMILLGGLEEAEKSDTRSGFPLLSRIPVVNWLFSSKSKAKSEGKLNIFIKPTIIN